MSWENEHWSSPNGCHPDCPACFNERYPKCDNSMPFTICIEVEVTDDVALLQAALEQGEREGCEYNLVDEDGEIDVATCLRMLADPGKSWPGTQIIDSTCE